MVDIFKKEICNYCKNAKYDKNKCYINKLIKIETNGLKIYKCLNFKKIIK